MLYKMYTDYCPYPTLRGLIDAEEEEGFSANEPLAWWFFKNLVDRGLLIEQGHVETPVAGWKQIVHSDIKPEKIFFTDRSDDPDIDYPLYKQPVLGDFGLAVITSPDDPHNPNDFVDRGTTGFMAPEQKATRGSEGEEEHAQVEKWGTKTNVWGIGINMMAYMTRDSEVGDLSFAQDDQLPKWNKFARKSFSKTLMRCVKYEQKDIVTFQELRDEIDLRTRVREGRTDYSAGMRFYRGGPIGYPMFSEEPEDKYTLGSQG